MPKGCHALNSICLALFRAAVLVLLIGRGEWRAEGAPANDLFAARLPLGGAEVTASGSNGEASKEMGETNHAGNRGGRSVWWSWTAPSSGQVIITTGGSSFDTLLAVYQGSAVDRLMPVASNDDSGEDLTSAVSFPASAGAVYQIAVDGFDADTGVIVLRILMEAGPSGTRVPRDDFWIVDGPVHAILETNGVIYLGGRFNTVSPNHGRGSLLNIYTGVREPDFPTVDDGIILTVASDGRGGWYLGGLFTRVNGLARTNLVHVLADNTVDPVWTPDPGGPASFVSALAVSGDMVFAGGHFVRAGGKTRVSFAALDAATGAALALNLAAAYDAGFPAPPETEPGEVLALAMSDDTLFVGGSFDLFGGRSRGGLAAVDMASGQVLAWNPGLRGSDPYVNALTVNQESVYVGGLFSDIAGQTRQNLAELNAITGQATPWNPGTDGLVETLAVHCSQVFVGGRFTQIGGQLRNYLAALDIVTGQPSAWNPDPLVEQTSFISAPPVGEIVISGNVMYVGGSFIRIGGESRQSVAALDIATGLATPWNPESDRGVFSIALSGNTLLAGGAITAGALARRNLVALDAGTGRPIDDWDPSPNGEVRALAASGARLYAGGSFTEITGQSRNRIAALDLRTGQATDWNPNAVGSLVSGGQVIEARVSRLLLSGGAVYAAGVFQEIGGQRRDGLAALDPATGLATAWRPAVATVPGNPEFISAMAALGNTIYLGGYFLEVDGQRRFGLAAVDATSGRVTPWDPDGDGDRVAAIAVRNNTIYVAGLFSEVGGEPRQNIAALDPITAAARSWSPFQMGEVYGLAVSQDRIYATGEFADRLGSAGLAALDPETGRILSRNLVLGVDDGIRITLDIPAVWASDSAVYMGGDFLGIDFIFRPFFAAFPPVGSPAIVEQPAGLKINRGQSASFSASAQGVEPLSYQWYFNEAAMTGETGPRLAVDGVQVADSGKYHVVVSNRLGQVSSRPAALIVIEPVAIVTHPVSQSPNPGDDVVFSVLAQGNPPPIFQWQLNGVNIPGAVLPFLRLTNVQPAHSGRYRVVVDNGTGAVNSRIADLIVPAPALAMTDHFADRAAVTGSSGVAAASNTSATGEAGEPRHGGKGGGKSVWFSWRAPANGIAIFHTRGSSFDTLLAAYEGTALGALAAASGDDDRGGFLASLIVFTARSGREYQIAVDGFGGASGRIVVTWALEPTDQEVPRIIVPPESQSAVVGADVTLSVVSASSGSPQFQWFHNCVPIPNATNAVLMLPGVRASAVGLYTVQLRLNNRMVESAPAFLELGPAPRVISADKLYDVLVDSAAAAARQSVVFRDKAGFVSVVAGVLGNQTLNNLDSTKELDEPNHAGIIGGASRWFRLRPESAGTMTLDTLGSEIDTVMAVYLGTDLANLQLVGSDNNSASDNVSSLLRFPVAPGADYLVAVDAVNAAQGIIRLNWRLEKSDGENGTVQVRFVGWSKPAGMPFTGRLNGGSNQVYVIETSADLRSWTPMLTNQLQSSSIEFSDPGAGSVPMRFYRARQQP